MAARSPRLAFVGQRTFFEACALSDERSAFFEFRKGGDVERHLPVWRSVPIPVADRVYGPPAGDLTVFVGRSSTHRESFLGPVKHDFDVVHVAHGFAGERLIALLREHEVGINLHNEPYPSFENRVPIHLAAGHLVISEPLSPLHGLEPGVDFLELVGPALLGNTLEVLSRFPGAYDRVRVRGRRKAELFRASRVYPRLVGDLLRELESGETPRAA